VEESVMADLDSIFEGGDDEDSTSRSRFGSDGSGLNYSGTDPLGEFLDFDDDGRPEYMADPEHSYSRGYDYGSDPTDTSDDRTDYTDAPGDETGTGVQALEWWPDDLTVNPYSRDTSGDDVDRSGLSVVDAPTLLAESAASGADGLEDVGDWAIGGVLDVADDATDPLTPDWMDWILDHQEEVAIGLVVFAGLYLVRPYAGLADSAT
jgi:hypothetical protein